MSAITEGDVTALTDDSHSKGQHAWTVTKHLVLFIVLILLWEFAARAGWVDPLLFPAPLGIVKQIWFIYVVQQNVWYHLYATFAEAMGGLFVGTLIGIGLATAAALSLRFRTLTLPKDSGCMACRERKADEGE